MATSKAWVGASGFFESNVANPATATDAAGGGVTIGYVTVLPPSGQSFSGLSSFAVAAVQDDAHGTVTGEVCTGGVGTVTVREAVGTALALDYRVTCGSEVDGGALRRSSDVPYALALYTDDAPANIPYSGATVHETLHNVGTESVVPGGTSVSHTNGPTVTVTSDLCNGVSVAPGGSCVVTLSVVPHPDVPREDFTVAADVPQMPAGVTGHSRRFLAGTPPSAPRNLTLVGTALGSVSLTWDPPADDGGNPVSYLVYPGSSTSHPTTGTSYLDTLAGLDRAHHYTVVAVSSAGRSPASNDVTLTTGHEALVVDRPDGVVYAADPARPTEFVPTALLPGGARSRYAWVGNSAGKLASQSIQDGSVVASQLPAGHDFADIDDWTAFARAGSDGIDSVYETDASSFEQLVAHGATQPAPSVERFGPVIYAVPAGASGPTGAPLRRYIPGAGSTPLLGTTGALHPAVSPDRRWLAYVQPSGPGHYALTLRTTTDPLLVQAAGLQLSASTVLHWGPDGRELYAFDQGSQLLHRVVVDPATGAMTANLLASGPTAGPAQWVSLDTLDLGAGADWYAQPGATYSCAVDGLPVKSSCTSPFRPRLRNGDHVLSVTRTLSGHHDIVSGLLVRKLPTQRDFTGDGFADIAVFRPSNATWYVRGRPSVRFGRPGDQPLLGDFDGDGTSDLAVYRPSDLTWYVAGRSPQRFGRPGDIPVPADYDGDGTADVAVFRPSTGVWYISGQPAIHYGQPGDVPYPGYWDRQGDRAVPAVCRRASSTFYALGQPHRYCPGPGSSARTYAYEPYPGITQLAIHDGSAFWGDLPGRSFGRPTDIPVLGLYNLTIDDITVFRPSTGEWLTWGHTTVRWGQQGDIPL